MVKILSLFIACNLFCPIIAMALDTPEALRSEVEKAIADGDSLYKASIREPVANETVTNEKNKIDDLCDFHYNAYRSKGDVYFIANPPATGGIVFGRHYRVSGEKVVKSTITCFVAPEQPKNAVGAYITHLLSDAPSEFHVFMSLAFKKPIYVGTTTGTWKVESGRIEFLEMRK